MRVTTLVICCMVAFAATSFAGNTGKYHKLPVRKMVNTSKILRGTKAMRIGKRMFLVSSKNSSYARAMLARYSGAKKKKALLAKGRF